MDIIKITTKIQSEDKLEISIPKEYRNSDCEVVLILNKISDKGKKYNFRQYGGKISLDVDSLKYQKEIRNEW